jgi:proteasome lid subunit RPN8/RPN11
VRVVQSVVDAVIAHALECRPAECCGVLLGKDDDIVEAVRSQNLSDNPNRYELDPQVHIHARQRARASGLRVAGFYHSHPHSEASPSATDLAEASYDDVVWLIVGLHGEAPEVRLFVIQQGAFRELPLTVEGQTSQPRQ